MMNVFSKNVKSAWKRICCLPSYLFTQSQFFAVTDSWKWPVQYCTNLHVCFHLVYLQHPVFYECTNDHSVEFSCWGCFGLLCSRFLGMSSNSPKMPAEETGVTYVCMYVAKNILLKLHIWIIDTMLFEFYQPSAICEVSAFNEKA